MFKLDLKDKVILITGGSGFIGSHVADQLTQEGYKVQIYDRTYSPWKKEGQKMIVGDLADKDLLNKSIAGSEIRLSFEAHRT